MNRQEKADEKTKNEKDSKPPTTEQKLHQVKKKKHPLASVRFIKVIPPGAV